jgi:hypothetical protein
MLCLTCVIAVLTLAFVAFVAYSVQPPQWITPSAHNGTAPDRSDCPGRDGTVRIFSSGR